MRTDETTPRPWRWEPARGDTLGRFVGANGEVVCDFGDDAQYYPTSGTEPSNEDEAFILRAVNSYGALVEFVTNFAAEPCSYGDGCPTLGTRHGTCSYCSARTALALDGDE